MNIGPLTKRHQNCTLGVFCVQLRFRYGSTHAQMDGTSLDLSQGFAVVNSKSWIFCGDLDHINSSRGRIHTRVRALSVTGARCLSTWVSVATLQGGREERRQGIGRMLLPSSYMT